MNVDAHEFDAVRDEPIFHDGKCIGYVTSGGYGHAADSSIAIGYVPTPLAKAGTKLEIEMLGEFLEATVLAEPLYDPKGVRMRS